MKPTIRVIKDEIHRIVEMAETKLANGKQHYQRGGLIVVVYTDPSTDETLIQAVSQQRWHIEQAESKKRDEERKKERGW